MLDRLTKTSAGRCRVLAAAAIALAALFPCGCQQVQVAQEASHSSAFADYEAGRYREAYAAARALIFQTRGIHRDHARHLAGLSAYRLGKTDQAISHLRPLASHRDPKLAGSANSILGLVHSERGDHARAVGYLQAATDLQSGDDRARAYYHLGLAQQKMGQWSTARTHLALARGQAIDPKLRQTVSEKMQVTGFTVQLGAYASQENAEAQARQWQTDATGAGLGPIRVVPAATGNGRRLFLLQLGRYSTFETALKARAALGHRDAIVTALQSSASGSG